MVKTNTLNHPRHGSVTPGKPENSTCDRVVVHSLVTAAHSEKYGGLSHTCGLGGGGCTGIPHGSTVEGGELAAPRLTSSKSNM